MAIDRNALEALSRDELVDRARALAIPRPEVLTRTELVDEIIATSLPHGAERSAARGLLGRARALIARVVDEGLNLPDAAQRLRSSFPPPPIRSNRPPLSTYALAEVYATQGYVERSIDVLDEVLRREPDHRAARDLRDQLTGKDDNEGQKTSPAASPTPTGGGSDQHSQTAPTPVVQRKQRAFIAVPHEDIVRVERGNNESARVVWSLRPISFARGRSKFPQGCLVVRTLWVQPQWSGPAVETRDTEIVALVGQLQVQGSTPFLCVALGWRHDAEFLVLATAPSPLP